MVSFIVKGFILAAGYGTRLRPITETVPKPLVPVGHLPLIEYSIRLLRRHGIQEIIINTHFLGDLLQETLGSGEEYGVSITYSEEEEILGTGGGLKRMHHHLEDDTFVVVNSDTLIDLDLGRVLEFHRTHGALATMVLREQPEGESYGQIEIDEAGRIRRILGNGRATEALRPLMFTGVHVLEPRFLEYIPPDVETCVNRYAYVKALNNDEKLFGFVSDGYWADAGTPGRYFQANLDALNQAMPLEHVDPLGGYELASTKSDIDAVRLGKNVDLGNDVRLLSPVVLGDAVRIGDNSVVGPHCVVGDNVSIGRDVRISEAIILQGTRVGSGVQANRTVLGKKARLEVD